MKTLKVSIMVILALLLSQIVTNAATSNERPVAVATSNSPVELGEIVILDGSGSTDGDNDLITYAWTLLYWPEDSIADIDPFDPCLSSATFTPDLPGTYVVQLVVDDSFEKSLPSTTNVVVWDPNNAPVADAGPNQSVELGVDVTLDGSRSSDVEGNLLTYSWSWVSKPEGSIAEIDPVDPYSSSATFTPDLPGTYVVQLVVNDGFMDSLPSTTTIQVLGGKVAIIMAIEELQTEIALLPRSAFRYALSKRLLTLELDFVIASLKMGRYRIALALLINNILPVTDGCKKNNGVPDRQDWIVDCRAQAIVYTQLQEIIAMVKGML